MGAARRSTTTRPRAAARKPCSSASTASASSWVSTAGSASLPLAPAPPPLPGNNFGESLAAGGHSSAVPRPRRFPNKSGAGPPGEPGRAASGGAGERPGRAAGSGGRPGVPAGRAGHGTPAPLGVGDRLLFVSRCPPAVLAEGGGAAPAGAGGTVGSGMRPGVPPARAPLPALQRPHLGGAGASSRWRQRSTLSPARVLVNHGKEQLSPLWVLRFALLAASPALLFLPHLAKLSLLKVRSALAAPGTGLGFACLLGFWR